MTIDEARAWLQRHADNTPMPGAREAYRTILDALERTEALREENKALRSGYANMWFAHRNADPEMPHPYETAAEEEAERLLGDWKTVMMAQYGPAPDLGWFAEKEDDDGDQA